MKELVLLGDGNLSREVQELAEMFLFDSFVTVADPEHRKCGASISWEDFIHSHSNQQKIIAVGNPFVRKAFAERDFEHGPYERLIHPMAYISRTALIQEGCAIQAFSSISAGVILYPHVYVNYNCVIGHNTTVRSYTNICPGVCIGGGCIIGRNVFIGTGAVILPEITIEDGAIIGAGAVVRKNVETNTTVVGVPARRLDGKV